MAIAWMTVLKKVPWNEVINNAPIIVDGAKKLWNNVGNRAAETLSTGSDAANMFISNADKIGALEDTVNQLRNQLATSTELIKALADQDAQLIKRLEIQRKWLIGLTVLAGALMIGVIYLCRHLP